MVSSQSAVAINPARQPQVAVVAKAPAPPATSPAENPYASPAPAPAAAESNQENVTFDKVSVEQLLNAARDLYFSNLMTCLGAGLAVALLATGIPLFLQFMVQTTMPRDLAALLLAVIALGTFVVNFALQIGLVKIGLALARKQPPSLLMLFPNIFEFFGGLIISISRTLVGFALLAAGLLPTGLAALVLGGEGLLQFAPLVLVLLVAGLATAIYLFLRWTLGWYLSVTLMIAQKMSPIDAMRGSTELMAGNRATVVISYFVVGLVFLIPVVGSAFAASLTGPSMSLVLPALLGLIGIFEFPFLAVLPVSLYRLAIGRPVGQGSGS